MQCKTNLQLSSEKSSIDGCSGGVFFSASGLLKKKEQKDLSSARFF
jgi:hypothetical protein